MRITNLILWICLFQGCGRDDAQTSTVPNSGGAVSAQASGNPKKQAVPGVAPSGEKIPADEAAIAKMLVQKFGMAVRAVRVEVDDESGIRVKLRGEVPSEEIKEAVMKEVASRVEGLQMQDFELIVSGPIPLLEIIPCDVDDKGAIFARDLRFAVIYELGLGPRATVNPFHSPSIWDVWARRRINRPSPKGLERLTRSAISPNGKLLATGHASAEIVLWEMPLGQKYEILQKPREVLTYNDIGALTFSSDGKLLATVLKAKGEVWLWDLQAKQARLLGSHDANLEYLIEFSPDSKLLASADDRGESIILWDVASKTKKNTLACGRIHIEALAWSPDSKTIAAGRTVDGQGVVLVDVAGGKPRLFNPEANSIGLIRDVAFSPDGKILAARFDSAAGIIFWDLATGKEWTRLDAKKVGNGRGMGFSPDSAVLAVAAEQMEPWTLGPKGIQLWDISKHPGGTKPKGEFPPEKFDAISTADDVLVQCIREKIYRTLGDQLSKGIEVERLPDGSIHLFGTITARDTKEVAERVIVNDFAIDGKRGKIPPKVVNDLTIQEYDEVKRLRKGGNPQP